MPWNRMRGRHSPCLDCEKRHFNCWSNCAAYILFAEKREAERERRANERKIAEYFADKHPIR